MLAFKHAKGSEAVKPEHTVSVFPLESLERTAPCVQPMACKLNQSPILVRRVGA